MTKAEQPAAGQGHRARVVDGVASAGLRTLLALAVLSLLAVAESTPVFAQGCSFDEQCNTAVCKNDGTCNVTPLTNGTSCNDFNPCTTVDQCASGKCTGTVPAPQNTACDDGNPCVVSEKCNASGQCVGTPLADDTTCFYPGLACPGKCTTLVGNHFCQLCAGADPCTMGTCNFSTGQCQAFGFCDTGCQTGDCVVQSFPPFGDIPVCMNQQDKPDNTACDDFNSCTTNDSCQQGECTGTGFSGPAPTSTPFFTPPTVAGTSTPTPTRTATVPAATATRTATVPPPTATATQPVPTATRTATVPPPTATKTTALPSATATSPAATPTMTSGAQATLTPTFPTPATGCIGDCNHNGKVSAAELVNGIDIVLGKAPLSSCMAFPGRTTLTVVDAGQAVAAALGDCAENPAAR